MSSQVNDARKRVQDFIKRHKKKIDLRDRDGDPETRQERQEYKLTAQQFEDELVAVVTSSLRQVSEHKQ